MAEYKIVLNGEVNAESVNKSIKQIESQIKPLKIKTSETSTKTKAAGQIDAQFKKASVAAENFQVKLNNLKTTGSLTKKQFDNFNLKLEALKKNLTPETIDDFNSSLHKLGNEVSETSTKTKAAGQSIKDIVGKFTQWYIIAGLVTSAINALKSIVSITMDLDKSFTSIQMVTGYNAEQVKALRTEYIGLAKDLGVTVDTVTSAADEWLRAGLSVEDTTKALTASIVLSKVAQMDSAEATQYLVAIMNGYNLEASQLISVVDKLSAVDVVAATSSAELAEALSQSAQSAQLAGIGFDKYLGMIATVSETTRQSASTIGNSFRSIFTRLQRVKIGALESGESISDVDKVLRLYDIDLMSVTNNLQDMGALLDTLGERWEDFTAAEKSEISTAIAGNYQREKFLVLMENYDRALELEQESLNSTGAAMDKYQIYQQSLEASINRLKDAWIDLVNSLEASGLINLFLTGVETILGWVGAITKWINSIGDFGKALRIAIPIIFSAVAALLALKGVITGGTAIAVGLASITVAIGGVVAASKGLDESLKSQGKSIENNTKAMTAYDKILQNLRTNLNALTDTMQGQLDEMDKTQEKLKKEKELQQKLLNVEKARQELAEAKSKRVRIYRVGVGFTYAEDAEDVQQAQENLQSALNELSEYRYETALDRAKDFISQLNSLLTDGTILEGWDSLFAEFGDLLDSEFASYVRKAEEFVNKTKQLLESPRYKGYVSYYQSVAHSAEEEIANINKALSRSVSYGSSTSTFSEAARKGYLGKSGMDEYQYLLKLLENAESKLSFARESLANPPQNASGTENFSGGATSINEHGGEIVNLPQGTEILSHNRSMKLTSIVDNPFKYLNGTSKNISMQFNGPLNFPNVTNADDASGFVSELISLGVANQANVK